ncbi:MAG: hypothetical protein IJ446_02560 [Oscillospiraceae bacterium]|nr:hypothetical protein [Oscillospiraceae bacterium]
MDNSLSIDSALNSGATLKYYSTKIDTDADMEKSSYLSFDSYLQLLSAQMSNQDFNNPMSDSEFLGQMANYSMMEAIGTMNKQSQVSYATSLVGKAVTVNNGSMVDTGFVESVIIEDDKFFLLVNGDKYTTDTVTDVIDSDVFAKLNSFVGQECVIKDAVAGEIKGEISNVIVQDGNGFVVVDGQLYSVTEVTSIGKQNDTAADEVTEENTEAAENVQSASVQGSDAKAYMPDDGEDVDMYYYGYNYNDGSSGMYLNDELTEDLSNITNYLSNSKSIAASQALDPDESTADAVVNQTGPVVNPAPAEESDSDAILDSIMSEMDAVSKTSGTTAVAEADSGFETAVVSAVMANGGKGNNEEEDEGVITRATFENASVEASEATSTAHITENPAATWETEMFKFPSSSDGLVYGTNSYYGDELPTERAFGSVYKDEAEKANTYGTKMFDIRFIDNRAITGRVDTDEIIGFTREGKAFTYIGYSGKGMLGEVVTWADGTQRVEVIGSNGSTWFTTTGKYSLDQICDFSSNYDLAGKLTPFEQAIRAAAKEYTEDQQAVMNHYMAQYIDHAKKYGLAE